MSSYSNFTPSNASQPDEDDMPARIRRRSTKKTSNIKAELAMSRLAHGVQASFKRVYNADWSVQKMEPIKELKEPKGNWEFDRAKLHSLKEIGQGNFGVVYKGKAKGIVPGESETEVAVKTLGESDSDLEKEFLQEAKIMKIIDGNNKIVRLLGVCTTSKPMYMIMQYMPRGDLKGVLKSSRPTASKPSPLSYFIMTQMARDISEGMNHLQELKIVHRDLAARNVLVARDYTCKIGDFGLTRDVYSREYYRMVGSAPLPVRWMAPESLSDGVFSSASDVWSFGVVMWEITTLGKTPYGQFANNMEVADQVTEEGFRLARPPTCPTSLYEIMRQCWQENPSSRGEFAAAMLMLENLMKVMNKQPITLVKEVKDPKDILPANVCTWQEFSDGNDSEDEDAVPEGEEGDVEDSALAAAAAKQMAIKPKSAGAAEAGRAPMHLYDMASPSGRAAAPTAQPSTSSPGKASSSAKPPAAAAPAAASSSPTKASAQKSQAADDAGVFARKASVNLVGLQNDTSAIAAKVTESSKAWAQTTYNEVQTWLEQHSGESLTGRDLSEFLKDGDLLCVIMNRLSPGSIPKFNNKTRMAFRQMENIGFFLKACKAYGLENHELFITVDLFEGGNMKQVLTCLYALRQRALAKGDIRAGVP